MKNILFTLIVIVILSAIKSHAHQPVMDMAPRWENGYGFQIRQEIFGEARPASTLVEISGLVLPGAKVEIEAVAVLS